jgi:hypothetical protein
MFTKLFWLDATERAIKTAAQAGLLSVGASEAFNLFTLDVRTFAGFMLGGAFLSLLSSVASAAKSGTDTASLTVDTKEL